MARNWIGNAAARKPVSLSDQLRDHAAVDVGQAEIASSVTVGQSLVVETHQVHHGGVQVVHVDTIFDRLVPELVGVSIGSATPHAAPGHPYRKSMVIVIAPGGRCR